MTSGEGFEVDPAALTRTANGITGMIEALTEVGFKETAASGRGFALLTLSALEAGKASVQTEFESYAERWTWGVRALVQAGNEIAEALGLSAGRYNLMEEKASEMFKVLWTDFAGNPHLSRDEVAARDWGETFADNPLNHVANADYSAESFEHAALVQQMNSEIIDAVGPQAAVNLNPWTASGDGPAPGWNTGASDEVAQIYEKYQPLLSPQQSPAAGE